MKIVYFIDHLRPDGTQRVLTQLVQGLGERGHSQAVVCLNDSWDAEVMRKLQASGCEVRVVGKVALLSGVGLVGTYRWLKREHFSHAVTMLFYADVIGRLLAWAARVPRVLTSLRARNLNYTGWQQWLVRRSMRWVDSVVINSEGIRGFAIQAEGADPNKIVLIPNGISTSAENLTNGQRAIYRRNILSELALGPESILIGTAGRLSYQKGFDILIHAIAHAQMPEIHLLIMGNGELENSLRRQAVACGLEGKVHFLGYRYDLPSLLKGLDLYVQPSRFEGMANAVLEAMAAACPTVASAVDGNSELICDGETGWLVLPEDSEALAMAILDVLSKPDEARKKGEAARDKVRSEYSLERMTVAWSAVLGGNHVN